MMTGGAGFIGSHLAERLLAHGRRVTIVDDLSTGQLRNIEHLLGDRCRLVDATVADALADDPHLLDGVTQVYHLAATVGVAKAVQAPSETLRNNIDQTAALIDAMAGRDATLLLASSSEVYGRRPTIPLREGEDVQYGPPESPRWSYALSKAVDERLVLGAHEAGLLRGVVARLFNVIGPRQRGQYGMVVPRFVLWAVEGQPLQIFGNGQQRRAFADVRDVVRGLMDLANAPQAMGRVYNVGRDDEITIDALADRVIQLARSDSPKQYVPVEQAYDSPMDDPQRRVPDLTRIREAVGFTCDRPLDQTLMELIELARAGGHEAIVTESG